MNFFILHLSDIHFRASDNAVLSRVERIVAAVQSADLQATAIIAAITGDIAFSGDPEEYQIALRFFRELRNSLAISLRISLHFVLLPGNHDCNFRRSSEVRRLVVESVTHGDTSRSLSVDASIIDSCLSVQVDFFNFLDLLLDDPTTRDPDQRLYYHAAFNINGKRIGFNCYNTAWLSQLKERQGQLLYPFERVEVVDGNYDLVVSAFHHPYNWLEANNARGFRALIESTSDLVLTGHEHHPGNYDKELLTGENLHYAEGAVLQDTESDTSGFNLLQIDLASKRRRIVQYQWSGGLYRASENPTGRSLSATRR
jgi:predicted MPP superfamily phosphohydrolase